MTKCLLKALKAVDLQNHVELFRSLGYDSAGALAHFRAEQLQQIIQQHVEKVEPPETPYPVASLAEWYSSTKQLIESLPVEGRYKQAQLAQLNFRYAELVQTVMERMEP